EVGQTVAVEVTDADTGVLIGTGRAIDEGQGWRSAGDRRRPVARAGSPPIAVVDRRQVLSRAVSTRNAEELRRPRRQGARRWWGRDISGGWGPRPLPAEGDRADPGSHRPAAAGRGRAGRPPGIGRARKGKRKGWNRALPQGGRWIRRQTVGEGV